LSQWDEDPENAYTLTISLYEYSDTTVAQKVVCALEDGSTVTVEQIQSAGFSNVTYSIETFDINIKEDICSGLCENS